MTKNAKVFVEGKKWVKKTSVSRGVENGGKFTNNRFLSMISCSKHFWGTCFHPNIKKRGPKPAAVGGVKPLLIKMNDQSCDHDSMCAEKPLSNATF